MSDTALMANSNNGAEKRLERAKRQAILMRIVESSKENLTYDEIAAKMREDPWIAARWPAYSAGSAHRDFGAVMTLVEDDVRELAMPYLAENLGLMDSAVKTLFDFSQDDQLTHKIRIDSLGAMLKYIDMANKVFGTYAAKEMHIKKAEITVDLDTFKKLEERAGAQLEIIDGELQDQ